MTEDQWERKLKINTVTRKVYEQEGENAPYEPTPYGVLEKLADSGYLSAENVLVDYGCGAGRAALFLSAETGCRSVGIDYDEELIRKAERNQKASGIRDVSFMETRAEQYSIGDADSFYFFNPFTDVILRPVLQRIIESYYEHPRQLQMFFYYPTDETVALLMTIEELMFVDEIDCSELFPGDARERIMIWKSLI